MAEKKSEGKAQRPGSKAERPGQTAGARRDERLAAALRDNLKRRKAQSRQRADGSATPKGGPENG
jgi:hypothetical protein